MLDYLKTPFSDEINIALNSHLDTLNSLLQSPQDISEKYCSAWAYVHNKKFISNFKAEVSLLKAGLLLFRGTLTATDVAMVHHWLHTKLSFGATKKDQWFQHVPAAYAMTLLILYHSYHKWCEDNIPVETLPSHPTLFCNLLKQAWDLQCKGNSKPDGIDVDQEAVKVLERAMFEISKAAGLASHYQWGLDAGNHQQQWNPFQNTPSDWHDEIMSDFDEEEYLVCFDLNTI